MVVNLEGSGAVCAADEGASCAQECVPCPQWAPRCEQPSIPLFASAKQQCSLGLVDLGPGAPALTFLQAVAVKVDRVLHKQGSSRCCCYCCHTPEAETKISAAAVETAAG
eukprot:3935987-Pleurochrysis_carterae.AAC.1